MVPGMKQSTQIRIAALVLFLGVALGAFGAHLLKDQLTASGHVDTWKTAVLYQFIHGLALFVLALHSPEKPRKVFWIFLLGITLFSGSLYAISLTDIPLLGPITPLGGLVLLIGWASILIFPFPKNK